MVWANRVNFCPSAIALSTSMALPCLKGLFHSTRKATLLHSLKFCINLHSQTIEQWPHLKITPVKGLFNGAQIPT